MKALECLQTRVSSGLLEEPAPSGEQIAQLIRAALRAPDHANLRPWEFILIAGEARQRLGELFATALKAKKLDWTPDEIAQVKRKPLRAPLIIAVVAKTQEHPKVPRSEQILSAGAAATNLINAAFALNIGAMWRTGSPAYDPLVKQGLGLGTADELVGFIYLGTAKTRLKPVPQLEPADFTRSW